jgi:hypothetical protein
MSTNVLLTKAKDIGYFLIHLLSQFFLSSRCKYKAWHQGAQKSKILMQNFKSYINKCKNIVTIIGPFLSFMLTFHEHKAHKILNVMLDPHFKRLKLVIQYVGNEITLWIER